MSRNKSGRPDWFKFWRRNRRQLDIEQLDMQSRGIIFTNMMRYFDGADSELVEMSPVESMAFNVLKIGIDDSFFEYAERADVNRKNGRKGGRPPKTEEKRTNPNGFFETQITEPNPKNQKIEDRGQKSEDRSQRTEGEKGGFQKKAFIPPSLDEVRGYCQERNSPVNPEWFYDYFTAGGWIDSKGNPVRSWKQKLISLERYQKPEAQAQRPQGFKLRSNPCAEEV